MKLDPTVMRTMNRQDFQVLEAVESGMRNHALVPIKLISSIANLRHGGVHKIISSLLRDKLLSHDCSCGYDGYRLTNSGYDILALHTLKRNKHIIALGDKIGTGKESDVYIAATPEGTQVVLKFHRLGRTSFRDVKKKRDYFCTTTKRGTVRDSLPRSWLFLSRMSALKEYAFMKALYQVDYPTPEPLAHNRHVVCMSLLRGLPLYQVSSSQLSEEQAESIFQQSTALAARLAQHGLVHCDLNEFNLLVDLSGIQMEHTAGQHYVRHSGMSVATPGALSAPLLDHALVDATGEVITEPLPTPHEFLSNGQPKPIVTLIDFPQMVSTKHPNAQELYERDLACLKRFFAKKLKSVPEHGWDDLIPSWHDVSIASTEELRLDQELEASGYSQQDANRDLELYYYETSQQQQQILTTVQDTDSSQEEGSREEESVDSDVDSKKEKVESDLDSETDDRKEEEEEEQEETCTNDIDLSMLQAQSQAMAEEKARARVRRQLEDQKKRKGKKGAFRSRNSNKTYVKGKRVMNDIGY